MAVDALSSTWPGGVLYAFPPSSLLAKVIERMAQFTMLLIAAAPRGGNLVSNAVQMVSDATGATRAESGRLMSASFATLPQVARNAEAAPVAITKSSQLNNRGFSDKVIQRIQNTHAAATKTVYGAQWKVFERWCLLHRFDPVGVSGPTLADFMIYLFEERKLAVKTIEWYRAALAATLKDALGYDPGQDEFLSRLLRNFKLQRPPTPKNIVQWGLRVGLKISRQPHLFGGASGATETALI